METMSTKSEPNKTKAAPTAQVHPLIAELATMEGLPIFEIRFCVQGGRDVGLDETGGTGKLRIREGRTITFLPKARLFRVVEKSRDIKVKDKTIYIPSEWASFEPLT